MKPISTFLTLLIFYFSTQFFHAQIIFAQMSRVRHDGGCYLLTKEEYNHLLHYTIVRNHMVDDLQILLVQTEAELCHLIRLISDNLPSSSRSRAILQLQGSLIDLVQAIKDLRRQHYTVTLELNSCSELQSIYQRRLSSRTWKPHRLPTRTRSCPPFRSQRYNLRTLLPFDYVQLRRGCSPIFEPDSE